jgi:hypothetical protein
LGDKNLLEKLGIIQKVELDETQSNNDVLNGVDYVSAPPSVEGVNSIADDTPIAKNVPAPATDAFSSEPAAGDTMPQIPTETNFSDTYSKYISPEIPADTTTEPISEEAISPSENLFSVQPPITPVYTPYSTPPRYPADTPTAEADSTDITEPVEPIGGIESQVEPIAMQSIEPIPSTFTAPIESEPTVYSQIPTEFTTDAETETYVADSDDDDTTDDDFVYSQIATPKATEELTSQLFDDITDFSITPKAENIDEQLNTEHYNSISDLYNAYGKKQKGTDTIFIVEGFVKALPENLSPNLKKRSVLNILKVSNINVDELVADGLSRIDNINSFLKTFKAETARIVKTKEAEIAELEDQIKQKKRELSERNRLQEKQENVIEYETHKIQSSLDFITTSDD